MDLASLYLSSKGRISRKEYWLASLPLCVLLIVSELLIRAVAIFEAPMFSVIVSLGLLVPSFMLCVKRFHDRDRSGWFALLGLIPVLGPLWLLVDLGLLRGTRGSNRFGPDPLGPMPDPDRHAVLAEAR